MTDLTISVQNVNIMTITRNYPFWRNNYNAAELDSIDTTGTLSGTVKEMGVLKTSAIVSLYYRLNGNLVARVKTDLNGAWSIPNLDKSVADYYAVAQTENSYNAIIYDKLTPV